jgi:hypothetical protein
MHEASDVADLGDEADRRDKRDPAQRLQRGDDRRPPPGRRSTRRSVSSIVSRYSCSAMC